jgi:hypothetical protein
MVKPGTPVSVVFYRNAQPLALAASVSNQKPFVLVTADENAEMLEVGKRALLILQEEGQFARAEAQILNCEKHPDGWHIEAGKFGWEEVDRRRYPRHNMQLNVTVKAVLDRNGGPELKYVPAVTEDISLGGAWIRPEDPLKAGSLVEFQADLGSGDAMRVLAIVAWSENGKDGVGLEFVDFLGGSRYYLHGFLTNKAA